MLSKLDVFIIFSLIAIGTSMSIREKKQNVMDSICSFGGNAACALYCFSTKLSITGHCDENNNCICDSTLTANNNTIIEEVEVFIINK
ncbi:hypothetical protein I4U23_029141 [Adineta vaga]|nr:hypothetical protein I4U23_029141 [Adineta vaga]